MLQQARLARAEHIVTRIDLVGGVFQNHLLTERAIALLGQEGFEVTQSRTIPINNAGLSFSQVIEFAAAS